MTTKAQACGRSYGVIAVMCSLVFITGCAVPPGPNQAGGSVIGGATGAFLGGAFSRGPEGVLVGGAIGALTGALIGKDIDEATRERVTQNETLGIEDVKALSKAEVDDDLIISQIKATRSVYLLDSAQILDLKNAGVSSKVIDYMINTRDVVTRPRTHTEYYLDFYAPYSPPPYSYHDFYAPYSPPPYPYHHWHGPDRYGPPWGHPR